MTEKGRRMKRLEEKMAGETGPTIAVLYRQEDGTMEHKGMVFETEDAAGERFRELGHDRVVCVVFEEAFRGV